MLKTTIDGMSEAIMVFNFLPATYADPSWIDAPEPWRTRLLGLRSAAARQVLSDWLLAKIDAIECFDFDFSQIQKAIFLQERSALLRLAAVIGLLRHRDEVRKLAAGGVLSRLAGEFGGDSLEWVLVRLPDTDCLPSATYDIDYCADTLIPQFAASGISYLLGLLPLESRAVIGRARLKFPRALLFQPPTMLLESERKSGIVYLKRHVFKEGALWD